MSVQDLVLVSVQDLVPVRELVSVQDLVPVRELVSVQDLVLVRELVSADLWENSWYTRSPIVEIRRKDIHRTSRGYLVVQVESLGTRNTRIQKRMPSQSVSVRGYGGGENIPDY